MNTISDSPGEGRARPQSVTKADLSSSDPYVVLGVERGAELREIKRAYFALVREYPPETQPEAFKTVRGAYEKLRTADTKAETDLFLFRPPTPFEPRKRLRKLDLAFDPADIWRYVESQSELGTTDFSADFRPVRL